MWATSVAVLGVLLSTALSVPVQSQDEIRKLFHGEDFHIFLPSLNVEVTFRNRSAPKSPSSDEPLMRGGKAVSTRAQLNSLTSFLIIESVKEADEGLYTIRDPESKEDIKRIDLIVRDCSYGQTVKYGDSYHIPLDVPPPITLEYKHISVEANQTNKPGLVLLTAAKTTREGYQDRIVVNEKHITLRAVTGADEGSYTIRDAKGEIHLKMCLNVREHHHFLELPQGQRMKINLILDSSLVQLHYTRHSDPARTPHLLLDKGNFTNAQTELGFEDRLLLDRNVFYLEQIKASDAGEFKVTDILGFTVTIVDLRLKPFKLEKLYVAIIALLAFVVFLLLACLVSCLFKVRKRAKRNAKLEKLAQNEDDGEAFRQVVKNITKLSEESKHSQADTTEKSQSTEVDIKGLEVSSKEVGGGNLETSDSGVGFNTALPLDTDTDAPDALPDSEAASITAPAESKPAPPPPAAAAASSASAPPAEQTKASAPPPPVAQTEAKALKTSPQPKKAPEPPVEAKLEPPKSSEVKLSPAPSPEPKASLSPVSPKPSVSPAASPAPDAKTTLAPSPEKPKPITPEPITNGTPEIGPDLKVSPDHPTPKAPKTPEVELKSSAAPIDVKAADPSKEAPVAAESAKTTSI